MVRTLYELGCILYSVKTSCRFALVGMNFVKKENDDEQKRKYMKVLLINGSPHKNGNTRRALEEVSTQLTKNGVESQIISIGAKAVQGCIACGQCKKLGRCVFQDDLYNKVVEALKTADALIVGSPTYYGGPNGSLCALLDRLFYTAQPMLQNKVYAAVAVARRGGATTTFQRLNMYAMMSNMPIATSQYWNIAYGREAGETEQDIEGLQTMRTLANNVTVLMKGLQNQSMPEREGWSPTSFIR